MPIAGWPETLLIHVWLIKGRDDWTALCMDFDLAAKGLTPEAAFTELEEIVADYVKAAIDDGLTYAGALRPVPLVERIRLRAVSALMKLRRRGQPRESLVPVHPPRLNAC